jgi:hypothetical protein
VPPRVAVLCSPESGFLCIEVRNRATIAYLRIFDSPCLRLAVDAFAARALVVNGVVERCDQGSPVECPPCSQLTSLTGRTTLNGEELDHQTYNELKAGSKSETRTG